MTMKLFIIESAFASSMPIFAESFEEAADLYERWELTKRIQSQGFTIERHTLGLLSRVEAAHLREALRANVGGFGTYHPAWGWLIDPPPE